MRTALDIMLNSAFPTFMAWGRDLTSFYNDAYVPILGDKPEALGRPFPDVWAEAWDVIGPIATRAMRGEASYFEDLPLTLTRRGHPEQTWFSFSYSPIRDEIGEVGGVLCTVHETTERVRAEAALRDSENKLAAILEQLPVGVGLADPQGNITLSNQLLQRYGLDKVPSRDPNQAERWRGYTPEGQRLSPSDYPSARALRGETAVPGNDFLITAPDGHEIWVRVSAAPFRNTPQEGLSAVFVVQDIDREKRTEQALRESEALLQAAVALVGLSPYTWNPVTGAVDWDARLKAMWGLPPDAHVDEQVFLSGIHPEDRPQVEAAIAQCIDPVGSGLYAIKHRVIGIGDGVERWVSTQGRTTFEHGRPVAFIGAALDITERTRAEAALRESEARFRQFADNSSNTLWILNFETMYLEYVSPAFEPVWGESREAVLIDPDRWSGFVHPDDRQRARGALERVKLGEISTEEFRIIRRDQVVRLIRNTFFPIRNAQGQIRRAGGIAQDITRNEGRFVYVVDGEETSRRDLAHILRDAGYRARVFSSGEAFLEAGPALAAGCVVLDVCRSGSGGLTVLRELKARCIGLPVVVLGDAKGDVSFAVQVMKAGAVDFLQVPYRSDQLLAALASAAASTLRANGQSQEADQARLRIAEMSEREREVLTGLLAGKTNKEIGRVIGISPRTVEAHRAHVMQRLGVQTLSQAVLIAASAGFVSPGIVANTP
ncbi:PAS domain S-box protein [Pseudaminobacter sp. 19-2017]|uniref:histidine kinase n=1 Tax=Pseudaminobacter soli (ex Zhang et al. 2022) TaxID=2831468 RepID=A0A942IBY7_9HYPH|nr:PAS domain S-box protein [Pseudaminobacter soli]MBS3652101.1 PAS domain S-box protein [Pseudaminobacter soli]